MPRSVFSGGKLKIIFSLISLFLVSVGILVIKCFMGQMAEIVIKVI